MERNSFQTIAVISIFKTGLSSMDTSSSIIGANASDDQPDHRPLNGLVIPDLSNNAKLFEQDCFPASNRSKAQSPNSPLENSSNDNLPPSGRDSHINVDIKRLIGRPLSERELRLIQEQFESFYPAYSAGRRYEVEATQEEIFHMDSDPGLNDPKIMDMLKGQAGEERRKVFIRHRIKKRWERLGVWNPEWGIPDRVNEGPRDKTSSWKWRWQGDTPTCGADSWPYIPRHPNSLAVHLREGWRRGERNPLLPPRCNLAPDASKSDAEAFITSRPWYTYEMDLAEEKIRLDRVPPDQRVLLRFDGNHLSNVWEKWRRGGWISNEKDGRHAWKWKHESPSPEPEDLSKIEFTPSEIDALEAIPPPTPLPQSSSQQRTVNLVTVPISDNQMNPKITNLPETEHALGAKPKACIVQAEPEAISPEAEMAELREEFHLSPAQWKPKGQPRGRNIKSKLRGANSQPRRSSRIAKRARQLEVAASLTNPTKAARPEKGASHTPKTLLATSTARPSLWRGRG